MFIGNDLRLKKRLVVLVCFLTAVFSLSIFAARGVMTDTLMKEKTAYTLVIDAGHGGIDCGALAADGSRESDINLTITEAARPCRVLRARQRNDTSGRYDEIHVGRVQRAQ